ncbi:hypothetical protein [Halocola ammonii]
MNRYVYKIMVLSIITLMIGLFHACKHEPIIPPGEEPGSGGGSGGGGGGGSDDDCDPDVVYFQQDVLPIFQSSCALSGCHDATTAQEGIILTDYNNIIQTGDIEGGDLDAGKVWEMITETDIDDPEDRMPPLPNEALSPEQIEAIQTWILQGAQNNSCESSGCDTLNVTYSGTIRPLIENRCEGCHSGSTPSGGISYETYEGVAEVAADGRLLGAINWDPDYANMPQNGDQLSQCNIDKIRIWIENGYPND